MKILVVDDSASNRMLLNKMLTRMRHQVIEAENGERAVTLFALEQPDLVLMDVMMPVMNGLDATKAIRALTADKWVPIFVLSGLSDANDVVAGLEAGADDYVTKPVHQAILAAKIASAQRSLAMQQKILDDARQLKTYQEQNEREHQFLQSIFDRLIKQNALRDDVLQFWLQPAHRFSGDLLCAQRIDSQRIYFMLADVTGHGLVAAVPTVLVNQVFQDMAKQSQPITAIAREINQVLHTQLPIGRFAALAIGMMDSDQRSIELWNGGLPDVWVLDDAGELIHTFTSTHTFAGVLDDRDFDQHSEIWHWQQPCELFLCSDGIADAANSEGRLFGSDRLLQLLSKTPGGQRVGAIQHALQRFQTNSEARDDISCLAIRCQ